MILQNRTEPANCHVRPAVSARIARAEALHARLLAGEVGSNKRDKEHPRRATIRRMFGLSTEATLTILAIFSGPIVALLTQRVLDHLRERRNRRLTLFRILMGTRAVALSQVHVDALNQIDVEFYGWRPSHNRVIAAWKALRNHLGDSGFMNADGAGWNRKIVDLRVELLHQMAKALGYEFEKDDILRNVYTPIAHGDLEDDHRLIRKGVVELLTGKRALSTLAWLMPPHTPYPVQVTEAAAPGAPEQQRPQAPAQQQPLIAAPKPETNDLVVLSNAEHEQVKE